MESRSKANGLGESKSKDGRVRLDGAAMAGPPIQNPKGRRLIPV
jgi:hypothetical protein